MRLIDLNKIPHKAFCGDRDDLVDALLDAPTVDAVDVDKAISAIQEMIESIDEDFPLLDFNSRYMMERGMRMSLIQIKKLRTNGERKGGGE